MTRSLFILTALLTTFVARKRRPTLPLNRTADHPESHRKNFATRKSDKESHHLHLATLERRHRPPTIHHPHPAHLGRPQPTPPRSKALQILARKNIELAWLSGSSHFLLIQAPEETARVIEDFIRIHR